MKLLALHRTLRQHGATVVALAIVAGRLEARLIWPRAGWFRIWVVDDIFVGRWIVERDRDLSGYDTVTITGSRR